MGSGEREWGRGVGWRMMRPRGERIGEEKWTG